MEMEEKEKMEEEGEEDEQQNDEEEEKQTEEEKRVSGKKGEKGERRLAKEKIGTEQSLRHIASSLQFQMFTSSILLQHLPWLVENEIVCITVSRKTIQEKKHKFKLSVSLRPPSLSEMILTAFQKGELRQQ